MLNKSRIIAVGAVIVLLAAVTWQVMRVREPMYEGKRLSIRLEAYYPAPIGNLRSPEQVKADEAIRHIGTNAIPTLLKTMRLKNDALRDNVAVPVVEVEITPEGTCPCLR